jgi:hypothetical protein
MVDGQDGRNGPSPDGAGIVHILKFYGFYEVVYGIPWLGASFAKSCGAPNVKGCATAFCKGNVQAKGKMVR